MKTTRHVGPVLVLTLLLSICSLVQTQTTVLMPDKLNLMPLPASVQIQPGRLAINSSFKVATSN